MSVHRAPWCVVCLIAIGIALAGCAGDDDDTDSADDDSGGATDDDLADDDAIDDDADDDADPFRCATPRGGAYPATTSYGGIHAGPRNDDFVDCDTPSAFTEAWHVLQGRVIAQPNTFSPDGATVYLTTSEPEPGACTVFALDAATGDERWCVNLPGAITSAVEVDAAGDLFVASDTCIVSLDASGAPRWTLDLPQGDAPPDNPNGAVGLHFTPSGRVATVTDLGVVMLIDRADGDIVASLDLPATLGFVPPASIDLDIDLSWFVPQAVLDDFDAVNGADFDILSFIGSGGQFSDNTVGVGPDGEIYVVGGGPDPRTGSLMRVDPGDDESTLVVRWYAPLRVVSPWRRRSAAGANAGRVTMRARVTTAANSASTITAGSSSSFAGYSKCSQAGSVSVSSRSWCGWVLMT